MISSGVIIALVNEKAASSSPRILPLSYWFLYGVDSLFGGPRHFGSGGALPFVICEMVRVSLDLLPRLCDLMQHVETSVLEAIPRCQDVINRFPRFSYCSGLRYSRPVT